MRSVDPIYDPIAQEWFTECGLVGQSLDDLRQQGVKLKNCYQGASKVSETMRKVAARQAAEKSKPLPKLPVPKLPLNVESKQTENGVSYSKVLDLWQAGKTAVEIAQEYPICLQTVYDIVNKSRAVGDARTVHHKRQYSSHNQGSWTPEMTLRMKELFDQNMTASQVAAALKVTRNAVLGKCLRLRRQLQKAY